MASNAEHIAAHSQGWHTGSDPRCPVCLENQQEQFRRVQSEVEHLIEEHGYNPTDCTFQNLEVLSDPDKFLASLHQDIEHDGSAFDGHHAPLVEK